VKEMGRKLSLIGVAMVGFLGPLEYSVVMPSLWFYLKEFGNTNQLVYSIILSSFSFAHMISSPLVGWLADRRPMKELFAVGLLVSAVGHIIYAMAWDEWGVLLGRFIAGLGTSNFTLISVYVARITTVDDRTKVTARLNIFTEMGLLLGPAFAILFEQIDVQLGPFDINKYTAPGYMMLILCLLLMVYLLIFFENPTMDQQGDKVHENLNVGCLLINYSNPEKKY
jgi:ceroid-lipofuscinosis MFS transporter 7